MTDVTIRFLDSDFMAAYYMSANFTHDRDSYVRTYQSLVYMNAYKETLNAKSRYVGEDAAEEMFDISNNPFREDARFEMFGRRRSLSVGDIVVVEGVNYLCAPSGWVEV